MKPTGMKRGTIGAITVLLAATTALAQPVRDTTAYSRDLWQGTEARFVRQWLVLAPLDDDEANAVAGARDEASFQADRDQPLASGRKATWRAQTAWGDVTDALAASGIKAGQFGLAAAGVARAQDGPAVLSLGGDIRGLWVNGAPVPLPPAPPAFVIDGVQVPVRLQAGSNRILLKVARTDRPALFALRVLEPGDVLDTIGNVAPYLATEGAILRVRLAAQRDAASPEVQYEAIAPGGRVMARATRARTGEPSFETASWPDGPYEVRVTTRDSHDAPVLTHLAWYKGDAAAAARELAGHETSDGHRRMLADMVRDRAGRPLETLTATDWPQLHSPLMEWEELKLERAGQPGGARSTGFVRLSWTDDVDGSTQFCRVYFPTGYPGDRRWPAVVWLHGYHPENPPYVRWWSMADRHHGVAERQGTLIVEPFGRGNVDYRWIGERDVLRCLAEAKRRFPIDDDRVTIGGESMGGNGTWLVASRHPELFAAAAPVFGGWDYRVWPATTYNNPRATRPSERFDQEVQSSFTGAEGLMHVPLYVVHGEADAAVSVEHSRHAVRMLQRWGYDVRYQEIPGRAHEELNLRDHIVSWLLSHRRAPAPREVRVRGFDLAGTRGHWLEVTGWQDPLALMEARAIVTKPGLLRLETKNVASVRLTPPRALVGDASDVRVVWNGQERTARLSDDGSLRLSAAGVEMRPGDKGPVMEGRLTYFFGTPFAIVVGTSARDPRVRAICHAKAEALAAVWERWQHARPRVLPDDEVTPEVERKYSLLLVGGPDANRVAKRVAPRLPLVIAHDAITIDGRRFPATDAVVQMLHPSPFQGDRYVMMVAATSPAGLEAWDPGGFWVSNNGYPLLPWDWTIQDGRRATLEPGLSPERTWIAAGIFDRHWRRDDRWTALGDEAVRSR